MPESEDGFGSSTWSLGDSKNVADGKIFDLSSFVCKEKNFFSNLPGL